MEGLQDVAIVLLKHKSDVNAANEVRVDEESCKSYTLQSEYTPLLWACKKGHVEVVETLLQYGASLTVGFTVK